MGMGRSTRGDRVARARDDLDRRIDWAREHLPEFNLKLVAHAMAWAERRPDAPSPITVEAVRTELARVGAVPLQGDSA